MQLPVSHLKQAERRWGGGGGGAVPSLSDNTAVNTEGALQVLIQLPEQFGEALCSAEDSGHTPSDARGERITR